MESEQFKTLRGTWSTGSQSSATCPPQIAAQRAALLFGCYRRGDANDPDTYCTAVAAVLTGFPQHVVEYVTDPRTGIPGTEQWLPSVAEVKQACIKRQAYLDRLEDFDRRFGSRSPSDNVTDVRQDTTWTSRKRIRARRCAAISAVAGGIEDR